MIKLFRTLYFYTDKSCANDMSHFGLHLHPLFCGHDINLECNDGTHRVAIFSLTLRVLDMNSWSSYTIGNALPTFF